MTLAANQLLLKTYYSALTGWQQSSSELASRGQGYKGWLTLPPASCSRGTALTCLQMAVLSGQDCSPIWASLRFFVWFAIQFRV